MVNFWLPIPTGALAFASLMMKPEGRGLSAVRTALSSLLALGRPDTSSSPGRPGMREEGNG
jgi:hypothetical protein